MSGVLLLFLSGYLEPRYWLLVLVAITCSALVFLGNCVYAHSLAFHFGRVRELARQVMQFTITFSVYPQTVFGGWLKVLLFTAIPAGFIGYMPVELLKNFRPDWLAWLIVATTVYFGGAVLFFNFGLKKYESGNQIGVRV